MVWSGRLHIVTLKVTLHKQNIQESSELKFFFFPLGPVESLVQNDNQTTTSLLLWPLTKNSRHYLCCNECHDHAANQRQGNLKLGINHTTLATVFPTKIVVGAFHCSDLIFYYW